jgi:hypothetical protein
MTLNHTIVPVRDKLASAKFLAKDSELFFYQGRARRPNRPSIPTQSLPMCWREQWSLNEKASRP